MFKVSLCALKMKLFIATIFLGTSLIVFPTVSSAAVAYTVDSGDTLWKVSQLYGTTVGNIMSLNNLQSTVIQPGQTLLVGEGATASAPVTPSRSGNRVDEILDYAREFTGVPYRSAGNTPSGFDCSGYTKYIFANFGVDLPRTAADQYYAGQPVSAAEAMPGDLVFFKSGSYISHVGIYLGGDQFISSTSSRGVIATSMYGYYWGERLFGFSRVIPV